jgi:hypothetical protein
LCFELYDASMSRFTSPVWRSRIANIALLSGVFGIGVWADLSRGRAPDFFDLQSGLIAMFFTWMLAELALPLTARLPKTPTAYILGMAVFGVFFCALAHALPGFMVGLIQAPFGGLAMFRSVFEGLLYTLRQAALPTLILGPIAGMLCGLIRQRADTE